MLHLGRANQVMNREWSHSNQLFWFLTLRKRCPYSELFCSVFSHIRAEYGEIQSIFPYSVEMWENKDQNNYEYGHFSRSVTYLYLNNLLLMNCLHILLYFPLESRNLENLSLNYLLDQLIVYCIVFHLISAGSQVMAAL